MPANQERIAYLLEAYSSRKATDAEMQELFQWLEQHPHQQFVNKHIQRLMKDFDPREPLPSVDWGSLWQRILDGTEMDEAGLAGKDDGTGRTAVPIPVRRRVIALRTVAAACCILLLSTAAFYFLRTGSRSGVALLHVKPAPAKPDVSPGKDGAILTLSNGQQIVLDSAGNGTLLTQGNVRLLNGHGQLSYQHTGAAEKEEILYNTITTTPGRQYQLVLADGSKVWLNASSSIRFPMSFSGAARTVEMSGEVYFDVARNPSQPFKVLIVPPSGGRKDGMEVQVLGTQFNINAYTDEAISRTTLLEGSIKILSRAKGKGELLKPGQQGQIDIRTEDAPIKVVDGADLQEAVAWKEGLFLMKKADIASIMRQVARWYDMEIVYPEGIPAVRISGDIPRDMNLSKLLEVMALSGVHCRIEGKRLVVTP